MQVGQRLLRGEELGFGVVDLGLGRACQQVVEVLICGLELCARQVGLDIVVRDLQFVPVPLPGRQPRCPCRGKLGLRRPRFQVVECLGGCLHGRLGCIGLGLRRPRFQVVECLGGCLHGRLGCIGLSLRGSRRQFVHEGLCLGDCGTGCGEVGWSGVVQRLEVVGCRDDSGFGSADLGGTRRFDEALPCIVGFLHSSRRGSDVSIARTRLGVVQIVGSDRERVPGCGDLGEDARRVVFGGLMDQEEELLALPHDAALGGQLYEHPCAARGQRGRAVVVERAADFEILSEVALGDWCRAEAGVPVRRCVAVRAIADHGQPDGAGHDDDDGDGRAGEQAAS